MTSNDPLSTGRGHLPTEQRNDASTQLDELSIQDTLRVINREDQTVALAVEQAIPQITAFVEQALMNMQTGDTSQGARGIGGRLVYLGAGTSGRLGVLDASEIPPTFFEDSGTFVGIIAGGDGALRKSSEGKEDDRHGAVPELEKLKLCEADTVIAIAAGGTTPYAHGAVDYANQTGALSCMMCCVPFADLRMANPSKPDHLIELLTGPEAVTGSTRMKAGTATKLALNMISTTLMAQRGKVWGNLMVDVRATNTKLRDRAARLLMHQCDLSNDDALKLLDQAQGRVKTALIMKRKQVDRQTATDLLDQHRGHLTPVIGRPVQPSKQHL